MTQETKLLKLKSRLLSRRDAVRKALSGDLEDLMDLSAISPVGDDVDAAVQSLNDEVCSRLIEMESQELDQIDQALERVTAEVYGRCEFCGCQIPAARLNALPYTDSCIKCQRENERRGRSSRPDLDSNGWGRFLEDKIEEYEDRVPIKVSDVEQYLGGSGFRVADGLGV
jgi:DnaK suppressor protein